MNDTPKIDAHTGVAGARWPGNLKKV